MSYSGDIELSPEPIPKDWILAGRPQARAAAMARSADGGMWVTAWACTPGSFQWHYNVDETAHILSGEIFVVDQAGTERRLGPGDSAYFPAGTSIIWRITEEVRKFAVCRVPVPKPVIIGSKLWRRICNRVKRRLFISTVPPRFAAETNEKSEGGLIKSPIIERGG